MPKTLLRALLFTGLLFVTQFGCGNATKPEQEGQAKANGDVIEWKGVSSGYQGKTIRRADGSVEQK